MDLSIIIINYKSAHHVLNCLESVYKETTAHSFEVIVVDNASGDDSEERIRTSFPQVIWLQTGYNAGFARANNAGIRIAKGDNVLLLNADTIILQGALDQTIELFRNTDAVACGVQLLNADGSLQISGAHFVKGGLNFFLSYPFLGSFIRHLGYKFKTKVPSITSVTEITEVDWVVGAFVMVRKAILDKNELLDEDFFMYSEEIEWCYRLKKHGRIYLFGKPRIIHLLGGTSTDYYKTTDRSNNKNIWDKKGRQIMLSNLVRVRKQYGEAWYLLHFIIYLLEIPLFFLGTLFQKLFTKDPVYHFRNVLDYTAGTLSLSSYFFRILRNKPFFYKLK